MSIGRETAVYDILCELTHYVQLPWTGLGRLYKEQRLVPEYEIVLNWDQDGQPAASVLHYDVNPGTSIDFQGFADDIASKFVAAYTDRIAPAVSFESVYFRRDIPGGVGQTLIPALAPIVGTAGDNQFARALSVLCRKLTAGTSRPAQGRVFQPGVTSEGLTANSNWLAGIANDLENFWDSMLTLTDGAGNTATMQIKASNPTAPNTVPYNPVSSFQVIGRPSTQRQRED